MGRGIICGVNPMLGSVRSLIVVGLLLLPSIALAADLEDGLAAYSEGDYETSLAECEPLAEDGDAGAQFCVGRLYANEFRTPDLTDAIEFPILYSEFKIV